MKRSINCSTSFMKNSNALLVVCFSFLLVLVLSITLSANAFGSDNNTDGSSSNGNSEEWSALNEDEQSSDNNSEELSSLNTDENLLESGDETSNENTVTLYKEDIEQGSFATITEASDAFKTKATAENGNYTIKVSHRSEAYAEEALILNQVIGSNLNVVGLADENGNKPVVSNKNCTSISPAYAFAISASSSYSGGDIAISNFSFDLSETPLTASDATAIFSMSAESRYAHAVDISDCDCTGKDTTFGQFIGSNNNTSPAGFTVTDCHISNLGYFVNSYFSDYGDYKGLTVNNCSTDTECKAFINFKGGDCTLNVNNCQATINGTYGIRGGNSGSLYGPYTSININNCEFTMTNTTPKENGGIIVPRSKNYAANVNIEGDCTFSRAESTNQYEIYDIYNDSSGHAQQLNVASGATINSVKFGVHSVTIPVTTETVVGGFNFDQVAKIGDLYYVHLQDAFNACQPGDTIQLLKDKITVADYGSDSYGKYTEITASSPTAAEVGTPMPDDALANIVLRKQNGEGVVNSLINSYSGGAAPSDYITIEGLHDDTNDGTQIGSLDFSGADYIKVKYLKFDAENRIKTYNYYSSRGTAITNTKDKAGATTINAFGDGYMCSICDVNYGGSGAPTIDPENSAAIGISISNCTFSGIITEEQFDAGVDYIPITCYDSGISGYRAEDWTVDSCNFACQSSDCMMVQYFSNARHGGNTITFTNNTCGSSDTVFFCDILSIGTGCFGNITVTGNKFYNWSWKEKTFDPNPTGGGCIWLTYKVNTNKTNLTIKNNEFNYTQGATSELKYVGTIRLRLNVVPPTGYLTLNGVEWDVSTEESKAAFHDALTSEEAGNTHPGRGVYYDGSISYEGCKEKWMYVSDVSFDTAGGSEAPETQYVIYNEKATAPADPTKTGATFKGWYLDGAEEPFDFENTAITAPIKLTAKWEETKYTVSFDTAGGTEIEPQSVKFGQTASVPTPDPEKEGYTFVTWMLGENYYDFATPVTEDITLTAVWKSDDGEAVIVLPDVPYDESGNPIVEIDDEAKQQALENAEKIVTDAKAGKDVVGLTAEQNAELQAKVKLTAGQSTLTVLEPTVIDLNKEVPTEEQAVVDAASLPNPTIACSYDFKMTLVVKVVDSASWLPIGEDFRENLTEIDESVDYKIRLTLPTEVYEDDAIQVLKVHQLVASDITSDCDINRTDHYADVPAFQFSTYLVNISNSLYLTFDTQGGSEIERQVVEYNDVPSRPNDPTKSGYTFDGWFKDKDCTSAFSFSEKLTEQTTIYAKWKDAGGGGDVPGGGGSSGSTTAAKAASTGDVVNLMPLFAIASACAAALLLALRRKRSN